MYVLSNIEKAYLRKIVINTRNEYLRREKYKKYDEVELEMEQCSSAYMSNNIDETIEIVNSAKILPDNIEKVFTDRKIMKIVKALTLREKLVLFSYYFENDTDEKIGKALNLKNDTVRKIRVRALKKIKNNYLKNGEEGNV